MKLKGEAKTVFLKEKNINADGTEKNRPNRYSVIDGDTIRREHDVAAAILSREKIQVII